MTTAQAIRKWRKAHDITQRQVATQLGVTDRTVIRWEGGFFQPSFDTIKKLERRWPGLVELVLQ